MLQYALLSRNFRLVTEPSPRSCFCPGSSSLLASSPSEGEALVPATFTHCRRCDCSPQSTWTFLSLIALLQTLFSGDEADLKRIRQPHFHMVAYLHSSLRTGVGITRHLTFSAVGQDPLKMPFWEDPLRHHLEWRFFRLPWTFASFFKSLTRR